MGAQEQGWGGARDWGQGRDGDGDRDKNRERDGDGARDGDRDRDGDSDGARDKNRAKDGTGLGMGIGKKPTAGLGTGTGMGPGIGTTAGPGAVEALTGQLGAGRGGAALQRPLALPHAAAPRLRREAEPHGRRRGCGREGTAMRTAARGHGGRRPGRASPSLPPLTGAVGAPVLEQPVDAGRGAAGGDGAGRPLPRHLDGGAQQVHLLAVRAVHVVLRGERRCAGLRRGAGPGRGGAHVDGGVVEEQPVAGQRDVFLLPLLVEGIAAALQQEALGGDGS